MLLNQNNFVLCIVQITLFFVIFRCSISKKFNSILKEHKISKINNKALNRRYGGVVNMLVSCAEGLGSNPELTKSDTDCKCFGFGCGFGL